MRRAVEAAAAALAVLAVTGGAWILTDPGPTGRGETVAAAPRTPSASERSGTPTGTPAGTPRASRAASPVGSTRPATAAAGPRRLAPAPVVPAVLRVPSLGISAAVGRIQMSGGVLVPPDNPREVGWWSGGARPGARTGTALITGHSVSTGGGAFDNLDRVRPGARVVVSGGSRRLDYQVVSIEVMSKRELTRRAARLFDQRVPGRLVLVTCENYANGEWLSNSVVIARRV